MNRATCVSFTLILGSAVLAAQSTVILKDGPTRTTVVRVAPPLDGCPISLRAQQAPGGGRMVVNGVPLTGIAQTLHLIVSPPESRRVVAANVTVRGFSNKARVLPIMENHDPGDAAKTLEVRFSAGPSKEVSADLLVPGLSATTVIDLNSVTYADGSTWKLAAGTACRSWIDGLMLVSSH